MCNQINVNKDPLTLKARFCETNLLFDWTVGSLLTASRSFYWFVYFLALFVSCFSTNSSFFSIFLKSAFIIFGFRSNIDTSKSMHPEVWLFGWLLLLLTITSSPFFFFELDSHKAIIFCGKKLYYLDSVFLSAVLQISKGKPKFLFFLHYINSMYWMEESFSFVFLSWQSLFWKLFCSKSQKKRR